LSTSSTIRTGSPMSSTYVVGSSAIRAASRTRPTASSMVMKNRVTSGWVTVTGIPEASCSRSTCSNDPRLPSTLPKRTAHSRVPLPPCRWRTSSAARFVAPRTDVGLAALSVEISTNRSTSWTMAASTRFSVPHTLDFTPSQGCRSRAGRCLRAAAWKTTCGRYSRKI
jgi:hypothetical protein